MPNHGDYDPHRGWYSANHRGWLSDPGKIGRLPKPIVITDTHRRDFERMQGQARGVFRRDPQLEQLIKLRESDKQEDRETFAKIAKGATRITLSDYEAKRSAHVADGGDE